MAESPTITVRTSVGEIVGLVNANRYEFRGIPYAEAPIGPNRLAAPVLRAPFKEQFHAFEWGATPQKVPLFDDTFIPEPSVPGDDILNLNVFAPRSAIPNGQLPVLFWIHGGGYRAGSAIGEWFHGVSLNQHDVIVVSVSYRLGLEGFGWIDGTDNNRGLRDIIMAMEWVRDHIADFGGDPNRVTIAGQSAGGGAVLSLTASPLATGLFAQAWSMSGVLNCSTISAAAAKTLDFARTIGVEPTVEGFSAFRDGELQQSLVNWNSVGDGSLARGPANRGLSMTPVSGDDVLPENISRGIRLSAKKPLVIGATADEFVGPSAPILSSPQFRELISTWELDKEIVDAYVDSVEINDRTAGRLITDLLFRSVVAAVVAIRPKGLPNTWAYDFRWAPPALGNAGHCADVPFFFNTVDSPHSLRKLGESPIQLVAAMHREFVDFIRSGSPGWAPISVDTGPVRIYDRIPFMENGSFHPLAGVAKVWLDGMKLGTPS